MSNTARKARKRAGVQFYKAPKIKTHEIPSRRPKVRDNWFRHISLAARALGAIDARREVQD